MTSNSIVFKTYNIREIIDGFAAHFNTELRQGSPDFCIHLPEKEGDGLLRGDHYQNGISVLFFKGRPRTGLHFSFCCEEPAPLMFIFATGNGLGHTISKSLQYFLTEHMCTTIAATAGCEQSFSLLSDESTGFLMVLIDRKKFSEKIARMMDLLPEELANVFKDKQSSTLFFRENHYNLAMGKSIANIAVNPFAGLAARLYNESQVLELLAMQVRQLTDELNPQNTQGVNLRKRDVELLVEARNRLLENLADPPTIKELAQITGTNENKLKAGFRSLYNTSINKLLQDARLNKARQLMAEENYPIKEVAKMVGYRHPAHFASKFKKHFGMLPNEYLKGMLK